MSNYRQWIIRKLLAWLGWQDPRAWHQEEIAACVAQWVKETERMAVGTSGEFKRQWVAHRVKKAFPSVSARLIHLHLEHYLCHDSSTGP